MKTLRIASLLLFLLVVTSEESHSAPGWAERPPQEDGAFKYYVGRASARSEAQAVRDAMKDAVDQAVKANFGVTASISSETYQTLNETHGTLHLSERSRSVQVVGFESVKTHSEKDEGRVHVWVLHRYSKEEIGKEKIRLQGLNSEESRPVFSQSGGSEGSHQTDLQLVTQPSGARVFIDGEMHGRTPLRIRSHLPPGPARILFDHPAYEPSEQTLVVTPGNPQSIQRILIPASGLLQVSTNPYGARVLINGEDYGESPLESIRLPAGKSHEIRFEHPAADSLAQPVLIERNSVRRLEVNLPLKPGKIIYAVEPRDAVVRIDGRPASTIHAAQLEPGRHILIAQKGGFHTEERVLNVLPAETQDLGTIILRSISAEEKRRAHWPWIFGIGFGVSSPFTQDFPGNAAFISSNFEKRLFGRLTLGAAGAWSFVTSGTRNGGTSEARYAHRYRGWDLGLRAGLRLVDGLHLIGEQGWLKGTYFHDPRLGVSSSRTYHLPYEGVGAAYEWSSTRLSGVMRRYSSGDSSFLLRLEFLGKW